MKKSRRLEIKAIVVISCVMLTIVSMSGCITPPTLDQEVPAGSGTGWRSIAAFTPMGQTFKPTMIFLDYIDVHIGGDVLNDPPNAVYTITLNVRVDTITGTVIATSTRTFAAPFYVDWQTFDFPDVLVIPESTYVIELEIVSTTGNPGWSYVSPETYGRGEAILKGSPSPLSDQIFRSYGEWL